MRDPIDTLLSEHADIMGQVSDLRRAVRELGDRGDAAVETTLPVLRSVGKMMATGLLCHAQKEDEALFPALEAIFGTQGTPTAVMRQEHEAIHAEAALYRETVRELHEIEHPAIVAQGGALREVTARGGSAAEIQRTAEAVIRLLDAHFGKEERILFPMARQVLHEETLARIADRMDEIESEANR
jgi:iron-sulfur cluster repair protein YtfE (RIC family)